MVSYKVKKIKNRFAVAIVGLSHEAIKELLGNAYEIVENVWITKSPKMTGFVRGGQAEVILKYHLERGPL